MTKIRAGLAVAFSFSFLEVALFFSSDFLTLILVFFSRPVNPEERLRFKELVEILPQDSLAEVVEVIDKRCPVALKEVNSPVCRISFSSCSAVLIALLSFRRVGW